MKKVVLPLAVSLFVSLGAIAQVVTTQFGQVQGTLNGTTYQFLGIPFAKPPIGDLRWKAPQNPDAWSTILLTDSFSPVCPQKHFETNDTVGVAIGNEDCLYLNIWTPQITSGANKAVMVYIHGGGNQQGGASEEQGGTQIFFGKNLSSRGDVVVVTIQYRLGPLGFLAHAGLELETANNTSGNYAILDQILALTWVKNNIGNFGGDTNNVTVFGESAGGVDVGNLLTSPLAAGLFERAIIESAVPYLSSYADTKADGISYVDSFTTTGTDVQKIAYMRSLPADSLLHFETSPIQSGVVKMNWRSNVDGITFTDFPLQKFQSGVFNKVPLIIGSNSEEMGRSIPVGSIYPFMVNAAINAKVPTAYQSEAHTLYPNGSNQEEARTSMIGILTDGQFTSPVRRVAECVSQNQTQPVFRYFFTHKHTLAALQLYGSYHGMELFYVFNNWENATAGSGVLFKPADDSTQQVMLQYWTNFAKTGNPNGSGLANWVQFQTENDCYMEIKATPNGTQCGLRTAQSDLWDNVTGYIGCSTSVTGINELTSNQNLYVFPNPTNGLLNIDNSNIVNKDLVITNLIGQTVTNIKTKFSNNTTQVDVSGLSNGVYFIKVGNKTGKFIKE
ncbi:MAG: carboxylesterase family protein [Edaphocola sp.]